MTKLAILEVDNGDIVHPDERLRAVIRTSNNPTEVLYLFLMHLSFLTKQPVQPDHDLPFQGIKHCQVLLTFWQFAHHFKWCWLRVHWSFNVFVELREVHTHSNATILLRHHNNGV